jgi:hypothetical protein
MSTATELLRRALESFVWMDVDNSVTDDIRAFLATEPEAEPVFIRPDHLALARKSPFLCQVGPVLVADFIPLYTRSLSTIRKPMTEEEIDEEIATNEHYCERSFAEGVRWAESRHEIGGDGE